jgi:hypothetical protein
MSKHHAVVVACGLLAVMTIPVSAQQTQTKAGVLSCKTSASLGLIVGSHQKLRCRFTSDDGRTGENYIGHINRLGLDLGITGGGAMAWAVLAPSSGVHTHALAGKYVGASGDISLGLGVGANALIGGSQKSIALQPLSVEGLVGVNLALGVAAMTLQAGH